MPTKNQRTLPSEFLQYLNQKDSALIELYLDLRNFVLELHPAANELLYHTHALTSVYSISDKLGDAYCMIPIYTNHLNLGFNKGTLLKDPYKLLTGTGNLIRHIDVKKVSDYRNTKVKTLLKESINFAIGGLDKPAKIMGTTISKINIK